MSETLGVNGSTAMEDAEPTTSADPPRRQRSSPAAASTATAAAARPHLNSRPPPRAGSAAFPTLASPRAASISAAVANRSAGALASARPMIRSTASGTVGRTDRIGGTGSAIERATIALGRGTREGRVTGEQLVEDAAEGVDVRAPVHLARARRLLGAHVVHGP